MIVYKDYDQKQLDHQYNKRAEVPNFQVYVDDWQRRSEEARGRWAHQSDLSYGSGPRETLDFFSADADGGPLLIFLHGGYWQAMDKSVFHFLVEGFLPLGVHCAIVNYPLAPAATMDEIVGSSRRALAWLARRASALGFDAETIHVSGHSAGGHLVAMLAATSREELEAFEGSTEPRSEGEAIDPLPEQPVHSVCALSGLFDLKPVRLSYLNAVLGMNADCAQRNSPQYLNAVSTAPLVVGVGGDEADEFLAQSRDFASRWRQQGLEIEEWAPEGANHFNILDDFCQPGGQLHSAVLRQLGLPGAGFSVAPSPPGEDALSGT